MIKGREVPINAIIEANINDVNFIARNNYNYGWKNQNFGSNYKKSPYHNILGEPNNYNSGASNGNHKTLEETLKSFITAQTEQNNTFTKLSNMEAQVAKIAESQTLILAKFAGKPEPNPIKNVKMMRSDEDMSEGLDNSHAPNHNYSVEDFIKMMNLKHPILKVKDDEAYNNFIDLVATKVGELELEYKKLIDKLPAKQWDISEPTTELEIGMNKFNALCDLGGSVSTIPKTLYDKLNLGHFVISEIKLNMADSTFKQAVGVKENIVVQINGCPVLIDLVIVDMPEDPIALIILGRPFLWTVKAIIHVHEGNIRFDLPSRDAFVKHFPRKKKSKVYYNEGIVLNARSYGMGVLLPKGK